MDSEVAYDIQEFYMLMGACNELAERDYDCGDIMDDRYKMAINPLFKKYNIEVDESIGFPECYLDAEDKLAEVFRKIMCGD